MAKTRVRRTYSVYIKPGLLEEGRKLFDVNTLIERLLERLNDPSQRSAVLKMLGVEK